MQWPFSSKRSVPKLLSFSACQDEMHKIQFDSGFDFESNRNNYPASQVASIIASSMANSPSIHRSAAKSGQNPVISISSPNPRPVAGVPVTSCCSPFAGTTDLRGASKTSSAPSQLTIFYNGSVSVYDNISPEQAQAIMLLAGKGLPAKIPATPPPPVPAPVAVNQGYYPCPSIALTSNHDSHSFARPDLNHVPESDSAKRFESLGTISQFRSKSLARFVEKRQQRVISMGMPYSGKQDKESRRTSFMLNSHDLSLVFDPRQTRP